MVAQVFQGQSNVKVRAGAPQIRTTLAYFLPSMRTRKLIHRPHTCATRGNERDNREVKGIPFHVCSFHYLFISTMPMVFDIAQPIFK